MNRTKLVCTMGPSCDHPDTLKQLMSEGMNVARLNMAHGELEEHSRRIRDIRQAAEETGTPVAVLLDIKGPEIRIGGLKEPAYELVEGERLTLTTEPVEGDGQRIPVSYAEMPQVMKPGQTILLDDGLIELLVEAIDGPDIHCVIVNGGTIKPRKGVNLPGVRTTLPGVTERDIRHIRFGVQEGIDFLAVSFVRRAEDILQVRQLLEDLGAPHVGIVSKIENEEGIDEFDAILEASDGIMVARGDLGVEIPVEDVPLLQREMIAKCQAAGKPSIVATHMLESMQSNPRPTRAEVSDVANAVLQGADAVMLSGETAAGRYPVEAVRTMAAVVRRAESIADYHHPAPSEAAASPSSITDAIGRSAVAISEALGAKAILTPTESGFTARMVSRHRPSAPIIALTPHLPTLRRLTLTWGVVPVLSSRATDTDDMLRASAASVVDAGLLQRGELAVVTAGVPVGLAGTTNLIKVERV
ncbi:pyruvate kinase [Paenibacillus sp. J31TS4]|uniref:pyruvate kinase n=1 Tax=Paenibacillus sp. J31TS4 TaxID=2807195 RepID=UPI001B14ACA6|nr:pyruvate kinase [Paenibacillus sp. J31TS4]GIP39098.1 pyruvate kinase [Paenibacillus sp. J31TS4]